MNDQEKPVVEPAPINLDEWMSRKLPIVILTVDGGNERITREIFVAKTMDDAELKFANFFLLHPFMSMEKKVTQLSAHKARVGVGVVEVSTFIPTSGINRMVVVPGDHPAYEGIHGDIKKTFNPPEDKADEEDDEPAAPKETKPELELVSDGLKITDKRSRE